MNEEQLRWQVLQLRGLLPALRVLLKSQVPQRYLWDRMKSVPSAMEKSPSIKLLRRYLADGQNKASRETLLVYKYFRGFSQYFHIN
jgi:hypothetical protein